MTTTQIGAYTVAELQEELDLLRELLRNAEPGPEWVGLNLECIRVATDLEQARGKAHG